MFVHRFLCILRTRDNRSPLQLAITRRLPGVVEVLCQRGADLNAVDEHGTMPLWAALMSKQMDIAATLVSREAPCDRLIVLHLVFRDPPCARQQMEQEN